MIGPDVALVRWAVEWDALEDMQDFAVRYCRRRWSRDLAERARVAVRELLENAVRYAIAGSEVALAIASVPAGFELRVSNDAVESRLALLRKHIGETAALDAREAYRRALCKLMNESSDRSMSVGLGLLRIRQEASVELSVGVEGKRATVIATGLDVTWPGHATKGRVAGHETRGGTRARE